MASATKKQRMSCVQEKLTSNHPLSLKIASAASLQALLGSPDRPAGLVAGESLGPSLVSLTIRSSDKEGYGIQPWTIRVGGWGLGCDDAYFKTTRSPIAVRFSEPIFGLAGFDDMGFPGNDFWIADTEGLRMNTSLLGIVRRTLSYLECTHLEGTMEEDETGKTSSCLSPEERAEQLKRWHKSKEYTLAKLRTVSEYRVMREPSEIIGPHKTLKKEWLASGLRHILTASPQEIRALARSVLVSEASPNVFSFDLFTPTFCDMITAEIKSFEATTLPRRRPNTMNNHGLVLNEIGMYSLMTDVLEKIVTPIANAILPRFQINEDARSPQFGELDHHHTFSISYNSSYEQCDRGLDMHNDDSEITLNVCLRDAFKKGSGGLRFCGLRESKDHRKHRLLMEHKKGIAVLHLGRQRHGAEHVAEGERVNLILWARSSAYRAAVAFNHVPYNPTELNKDADVVCLSKTNDYDYAARKGTSGE